MTGLFRALLLLFCGVGIAAQLAVLFLLLLPV